jgi:hypothetical protein
MPVMLRPALPAAVAALLWLGSTAALAEAAPGADEFKVGMQFFRNRDCVSAVGPLAVASKTAPRPGALLGLGYCYRLLKRFPEAIQAYQSYLEAGFEEEARVALLLEQTMEEELEWSRLHPAPPPVPPPATPPPAPVTPLATPSLAPPAVAPAAATGPTGPAAADPAPAERPRLWTWVAGGAAAASLGGGLLLGRLSAANAQEIKNNEHPGADVARLRDSVKWQAQKGNLLVGVGAGLAAISTALFVLRF